MSKSTIECNTHFAKIKALDDHIDIIAGSKRNKLHCHIGIKLKDNSDKFYWHRGCLPELIREFETKTVNNDLHGKVEEDISTYEMNLRGKYLIFKTHTVNGKLISLSEIQFSDFPVLT